EHGLVGVGVLRRLVDGGDVVGQLVRRRRGALFPYAALFRSLDLEVEAAVGGAVVVGGRRVGQLVGGQVGRRDGLRQVEGGQRDVAVDERAARRQRRHHRCRQGVGARRVARVGEAEVGAVERV